MGGLSDRIFCVVVTYLASQDAHAGWCINNRRLGWYQNINVLYKLEWRSIHIIYKQICLKLIKWIILKVCMGYRVQGCGSRKTLSFAIFLPMIYYGVSSPITSNFHGIHRVVSLPRAWSTRPFPRCQTQETLARDVFFICAVRNQVGFIKAPGRIYFFFLFCELRQIVTSVLKRCDMYLTKVLEKDHDGWEGKKKESCGDFFPVWGHWLTPFVREHFCICARCLN